jgi:hypothetical protein
MFFFGVRLPSVIEQLQMLVKNLLGRTKGLVDFRQYIVLQATHHSSLPTAWCKKHFLHQAHDMELTRN